ncbi:MAG: transcriptional regulator, family [Devosia sp.]|nr:transcriptional regulator, family [Devosia sp.]
MLSKIRAAGEQANPLRLDAGAWLKHLREDAELSQRDLANRLALDYYTFISQLENGRGKIPSNRYREWATALQVDEKVFVKKMLMYYDPHSYEVLFGDEAA